MFAVILYHGIDSGERWDRPMTAIDREYVLGRELFEQHIMYLSRAAVRVSSLHACRAPSPANGDSRLRVALTFDDGDLSCYTTAAPILERAGFRGEFFVVSRWIGRAGFMTDAHLRELADRGHGIQSHSRTHPMLTSLVSPDIAEELMRSKDEIESMTGRPVEYFSIPNGAYDDRVIDAARMSGYAGVLNSVAGYNRGPADPFVIQRFSPRAFTGVGEIAAICERPRYTAARLALKRSTLGPLKRVLGARYHRVRDALVSRKRSDAKS